MLRAVNVKLVTSSESPGLGTLNESKAKSESKIEAKDTIAAVCGSNTSLQMGVIHLALHNHQFCM